MEVRMPKIAVELSAMDIKRLNKPGAHATGYISGLLLIVKDSGAKSWILRTMIGGKRRSIGLGPYPEISLAEARNKARAYKEDIRQGIDPLEQKKARQRSLINSQNGRMTFAKAAKGCHEKKISEFRNDKHGRDWISSINRYAAPIIGNLPVDEIDLTHVLKILEPIWHEKTETATRLRQRIENVLAWATVSGYRSGDNPARWKGHLDAILPKPSKIKKVEHFKALPWQNIGAFMQDLRNRNGFGARCLEWIILTVARSGEARLATWDEIDMENRVWTIPAERMKTGKEHKVPLVNDAKKLLDALPRFQSSNYVFTAARGGPLSDMSVSAVCRRMKVEAVPHGFRSTFRDWCAENTNFPREVAEMALAHTIGNQVEAAYRRGDLFEKRRRLMDAWSEYCNQIQTDKKANVRPIRGAK
ncbi:MAG: integrase arm-type DNA-binding domain-containing protein [Deltaproteobacteria bacterium]|nr:integrase arm-type DNA-binding domain-containing protein [Deltaproteobacteria bacterium]